MPWSRIRRARWTGALGTTGLLLCACAGPWVTIEHAPRAAVLRAGDRFLLYDRRLPELRHLVSIRTDGLALLPYIGRQYLLGMSEQDAGMVLTEEFQKHFESVDLRVHRIAEARTKVRRVPDSYRASRGAQH